MTFQDFLSSIGLSTPSFWGILLFLASIGIEVIPKCKWSPWSALFQWIGTKFNTHIDRKLDTVRGELNALDTKITSVQTRLDDHISESEAKSLRDTRKDILDFCNACMNGRRHTKEQYEFMIKQCDLYEEHIKKNSIKNGIIEAAITEIRRLYKERLQKNDFLREGDDPEEFIKKSILEEVIKEIHRLHNERVSKSKASTAKKPTTRKTTVKIETEKGEAKNNGSD